MAGGWKRFWRLLGGKRSPVRGDLVGDAEALLTGRGEASGVAIATELLQSYAGASDAQKLAFLLFLAEKFGADHARLQRSIATYQASPDPRTAMELHTASEPRRQELIRRLNRAPGGTEKLVRMREDVIRHLPKHPTLEAIDVDFVHLFSSWFHPGFLVLKRIDWSTPADLLEKIIRYEAVHAIKSWTDLRRRLDPGDRRCFAFFHPTLDDEPLVFVEVAFTSEIPSSIAPLLAEARPGKAAKATTAVFYSISNCQPGLRGVSLGNFLIKHVVEELLRELPHLKTFVTLSPVPGFARWLQAERQAEEPLHLSPALVEALAPLDAAQWPHDAAVRDGLRAPLLAAAAAYFLKAKGAGGRPLDPVARFHLGNGARLERLDAFGALGMTTHPSRVTTRLAARCPAPARRS